MDNDLDDRINKNDPSVRAVEDAESAGVAPGFMGGSDWPEDVAYRLNGEDYDKNGRRIKRRERSRRASDDLSAAERNASNGDDLEQPQDSLDGNRNNEVSAKGFYSGRGKGKNKKGKGEKKGWLKKGGPIGAITGLLAIAAGFMGGVQNMMPIAVEEMIIEKFNSIGISSTMASDGWLDTQLNQGVRVGNLRTGESSENLFAFSEYQVDRLESQGLRVVTGIGDLTQITAILYKKDNMWIPVVGSDMVNYESNSYSESQLIDAIRVASGLDNIGSPVSPKDALMDSNFKVPYTKASKAWRGGSSGWFDNIMSNVTEQKLSITRNRWSRWVAKSMSGAKNELDKVIEEFNETARSANLEKTGDDGVTSREGTLAEEDEDGTVHVDQNGDEQKYNSTKEIDDVEYDMDDVSEAQQERILANNDGSNSVNVSSDKVTKSNITVEGISKVLNSKAIKAASAIGEYGCALLEGLVSIYTTVSAYQSLQFLNLISGFLESVDKIKAGDGTASPINEYSANLTTKEYTRDDNDEIVGEEKKTAMESAGMAWLFGKNSTISPNDQSVRNVNFENIMSSTSVLFDNFTMTLAVYEHCGYVKAGVAAVDLATTIISFIPIAGQAIKGIQIGIKTGVKIAVKAAVQIALYAVIPIAAKNLAKMMIQDAATEWFGEDLGNAIISGANKYLGGNGTSGGQSPASEAKVMSYLGRRDAVIAEEAKYQRAIRSPFDITSRYTFLGSLAYSIIPLAYSNGWMASTESALSMVSSSLVAMLPTANAINDQSVLTSTGNCDLLGSAGAVGDAFCNPYIITDTSTMDTSPVAVNNIVRDMRSGDVVAASDIYEKVGSENFNDDGSIKNSSNLAKYITYCGQRTSQYGIKDATIANQLTGQDTVASKIIGVVPGLNNLQDIYAGLAQEDGRNLAWANGSACVASEENEFWDEYKWYQRYAENERLLENMNPGYTSTVTAYLDDYYEKNPLDQSLEGIIARFTGMSKEKVEDTFALIEYYEFLNDYNPAERYAFGGEVVEKEEKLLFDNDNNVAKNTWVVLLGQINYADVRNRNFAV